MYKIKCVHSSKQYAETALLSDKENSFEEKHDAENALYAHVLQRLETINMEHVTRRPFVFIPKMNVVAHGQCFPVAIYARFNNRDEFSCGFYVEKVAETDCYEGSDLGRADALADSAGHRIQAILVERDYKGIYERFALTSEEFEKEFHETAKSLSWPLQQADSDTLCPLVHIWFCPCFVGDDQWNRFFTDMTFGLPDSDIAAGNLAYIREDAFRSLKQYVKNQEGV